MAAAKNKPAAKPRSRARAGTVKVKVKASVQVVSVLPDWLQPIYAKAVAIDAARYPYVFGGGHNPQFAPSIGLTDGSHGKGYDCSGVVDAALHAGKLLASPLATGELLHWGSAGRGEWMTAWVVNGVIPDSHGRPVFTAHCVLEFMKGVPVEHRFLMGHFTGGPPCGFASSFDTTHYHARRRAA